MPKKQVKMPPPPKGIEKKYAAMIEYMVSQVAQRFRNQVLLNLDKGTVEKFSDAQVGNYAAITLSLANRARAKLNRQFSNKKLTDKTKAVLSKADKYNQTQTYKPIQEIKGINTAALIAKEGLKPQINALMLESAQWAKKLRNDTLEHFTANTLRAMSQGKSVSQIISEFDKEALKSKTKAKFIARNQISNFNGMSTKLRHEKLGIKKGIWVTSRDERVRGNPSGKYPPPLPRNHFKADKQEFELSKGFTFKDGTTLFPGQDFNCRCTYRAIIPEVDE